MILVGSNLIQVIFAFALFYRTLYQACNKNFMIDCGLPLSNWDWVNFSTMTLTLLGDPTIKALEDAAKSLVSLQALIGLFLDVIVIANFASLLLQRSQAAQPRARPRARARLHRANRRFR